MVQSLKYAQIERERRFLLDACPSDLDRHTYHRFEDKYITASTLRLRKVTDAGNVVEYKLNQKIRRDAAHRIVTSVYLTASEYARLAQLPGKHLTKRRYAYRWNDIDFGIDVFDRSLDGLIVAEVEARSEAELKSIELPTFARFDVTDRVELSGAELAADPEHGFSVARALLGGTAVPTAGRQAMIIRNMLDSDPPVISQAFANKPEAQYRRYLAEQQAGERVALVALYDGVFAGYVTIVWTPDYAHFRSAAISEIQDLNVIASMRRRGVAAALLDEAEALIAARSPIAGIGVGLHSGYNAAQRLYGLRGYVPDGNGVAHGAHFVEDREYVPFDDDLVLHLTKLL